MRAAWATRPWVDLHVGARPRDGRRAAIPIAPERAEVIPTASTRSASRRATGASARAALGIAPERRVVGTVGRLKEQKGHTYLLQAAERLAERAATSSG